MRQTRYEFFAKKGDAFYKLVNINPENNTVTYKNKYGTASFLKLDEIEIVVKDNVLIKEA